MAARKPDPRPAAGAGDIEFEQALERLETIVEELEGGELTLEESLGRYEEGIRLSRGLTRTLDAAEKRIERLVEGANGETATEPMELEARGEGAAAPAADEPAPRRATASRGAPAPDAPGTAPGTPARDDEEGRLPF